MIISREDSGYKYSKRRRSEKKGFKKKTSEDCNRIRERSSYEKRNWRIMARKMGRKASLIDKDARSRKLKKFEEKART